MQALIRGCGMLVMAVLIAATALAADEAKPKKGKGKGKSPGTQAALGMVKSLELTDEQKQKVEEIGKSFDEKLMAARALMPADVVKARQEAMKKAKSEGKKGKEAKQAVEAALNLTDAQKESIKSAQAAVKEVNMALKTAVLGVLTEEQKAKLPGKKKKKNAA